MTAFVIVNVRPPFLPFKCVVLETFSNDKKVRNNPLLNGTPFTEVNKTLLLKIDHRLFNKYFHFEDEFLDF